MQMRYLLVFRTGRIDGVDPAVAYWADQASSDAAKLARGKDAAQRGWYPESRCRVDHAHRSTAAPQPLDGVLIRE